jgi:hypothetical protein
MLTKSRGLPAGYLVALEKRLGETEAALHQTLSELFKGRVPENAPVVDVVGKGKLAIMDEWYRLPLGNKNDQYNWWIGKSGRLGSQAIEEDNRAVPLNTEPEREIAFPEDMQSGMVPDHNSSAWESSNIQTSESLPHGENIVQPMEEIHDVHSNLTFCGTHQRDTSLLSGSHQLHANSFGPPRKSNTVGSVNRAEAYAAVHNSIYF